MKMNPVVHFEMPYEDKNRMADFYAKSFGWAARFFGEEMGNYVVAMTAEAGEDGRPKTTGSINGGFYDRSADGVGQCPSVVISVDNVNESLEKIKLAGGKILGEPMEIPGVGMFVSFVDTEGNRVSILQASESM
jgi:hypothetical protein